MQRNSHKTQTKQNRFRFKPGGGWSEIWTIALRIKNNKTKQCSFQARARAVMSTRPRKPQMVPNRHHECYSDGKGLKVQAAVPSSEFSTPFRGHVGPNRLFSTPAKQNNRPFPIIFLECLAKTSMFEVPRSRRIYPYQKIQI